MKQRNGRFIFYHRTDIDDARSIVEKGFENSSGYFLGNRIWTGVWLASVPLDCDLAKEEALLMVKVEIEPKDLSRWEWTAEGKGYREWLIPASLVNKCATVQPVDVLEGSIVAA